MSPLRGNGDTKGTNLSGYLLLAGDEVGFTVTGALLAAGVEVDWAAGLAVGCGALEPAGRKPRLLGLFSI